MRCARIALDMVQRSRYIQDIMICVSWINGQEEYCLSSASRYQSIVDNRMKIECTPNVVDAMEYSTPNLYIVL